MLSLYRGNLRLFRDHQKLLLSFYLALGLSAFVFIITISSFFDIVFHFPFSIKFTLVVIAVTLGMGVSFAPVRNLKSRVRRSLTEIYQSNKDEFGYSPNILQDIEERKIYPSGIDEFEYEHSSRLRTDDFSPASKFGLKKWMQYTFSKQSLIILIIPVILFFLTLFFIGNPLRVLSFSQNISLPEAACTITPQGGVFYYGSALSLEIKMNDSNYKFLAVETSFNRDGFQRDLYLKTTKNEDRYLVRFPFLTKSFRFRILAVRGIEKVVSKSYQVRVKMPVFVKGIEFKVFPPRYTNKKPYTTSENLVRVFYGSRIQGHFIASADSQIDYKGMLLKPKIKDEEHHFYHNLGFYNMNGLKLQYGITNRDGHDLKKRTTPVFEFLPANDSSPEVQIETQAALKMMKLPEAGRVSWQFKASDDYGVRNISVFVLSEGRLLASIPIRVSKLVKKKTIKGYSYQGDASVDLKKYKGQSFFVIMGVRDNSLIPSKFLWQSKLRLGQTAKSEAIQILLPKDAATKTKWEQNSLNDMVKNLQVIKQEYNTSEKELKQLLSKGTDENTSVERLKKNLKKWTHKRQQLKKNLENFKKQIDRNIKTSEDDEQLKKLNMMKNITKVLDEKIAEREKELKRLIENFPRDYMVAKQKVRKVSRSQYLQGLENSIEHLKKLLALKKIKLLQKELNAEIGNMRKLQDKIVANLKNQNLKNNLEKHKKNVQSIEAKAKQFEKEIQKDNQEQMNLTANSTELKNWQASRSEASSAQKRAGQIKALSKMQDPLMQWQKRLDKAHTKMGGKDIEKALKVYRQVAFKINEISRVFSKKVKSYDFKYTREEKMKFRKLGENLSLLKDSYNSSDNYLVERLNKTGLLNLGVVQEMKTTFDFFDSIQYSIENNMASTIRNDQKRLVWKFNRTSLALLKEMGKMQTQMAQISQGQMKKTMQGAGKMQQEMRKQLQKMGRQQLGKQKKLSESEQAYVKEMLKREAQIQKRLRDLMGRKELEGSSVSKKAAELSKELKKVEKQLAKMTQRSDLRKTEKKLSELSKKFLRAPKSIKRRKEISSKRESQKPNEYVIQAPVKPLEESKKLPDYDYNIELSESQRIFFENYLQNLEYSQQ